jgi:hypothetical protein
MLASILDADASVGNLRLTVCSAVADTPALPGGLQDVIWAFIRTSPGLAGENVHILIHHKFGRAELNLTCIPATVTAATDMTPSPPPPFPPLQLLLSLM